MENHVWSVIERRMKHNHTSWSKREMVEEIWDNILLSAQTPKKDGKGYRYPVMGHLVGLEMNIRGDRVKLNTMQGIKCIVKKFVNG